VDLPGSGIVVGAGNVVAPLVIGTALATFAAYVPARRASRLSPMAAVRDVERSSHTTRARYIVGGVLLLVGLVLNVLGVPLLLIGAALVAPLAIAPLAGVIGRASARVGGLPAQLGHQNAARNPRRTASTASALMIGLALVVGLTITADSALSTFGDALDSAVTADFIVDSEQTHLSPEVSGRLADLAELSAVSPMRFGEFELVDAPNRNGAEPLTGVQSTSAVDPETIGAVSDLGYSDGALDRLSRGGGVLVSTKFSEKYGWRTGDVLSMRFARTGVQPITIAGTYEEDTLEDQGFVMSMRDFAPNFTDQLDIRILLAAADDVKLDDAKAAIEEVIAAFPNARVQTNEEYAAGFADRLDIALAIVAVILGLAVVIAVLGVVNTLALSMVERIRELGLLRAVGMTRAQMRAMVRWEAITIGVIGGVLGIVAGIPVGSSLAGVLGADGVTFPWLRLLLFLVFAVLAGVVASVLPARRAAHLDVLAALDHE
jgi:putative ABC transport system permease protein